MRKPDRKFLEQRRLNAIALKKKGWSQYKIANHLGVSFEAVSKWVKANAKSGVEGLKSKGSPGPKPKLTADERERLKAAILEGPRSFGYKTGDWTLKRIAVVIKKICGARFKATQTWRIATSLGFSRRKPSRALRSKELDKSAIKVWRLKDSPEKKSRLEQLYSGISRFIRRT